MKHGVRLSVGSLYRDEIGNPQLPKKFRWARQKRNRKRWAALAATLFLLFALAALFLFLRKPPPAATGPQAIRSIAVLPLDNYSGDPSQDYFAEGMTDELTTDLATISQLRVISRSSTTQFAGAHRPPTPEIGKLLNVDAVVEGSVRRAGDKVRITAQLIDARADRHLWAKTFEGDSRDVLALQDQLAAAIAGEINVQLTPSEKSRLTTARAVNPEAHDAYLKGRYFFNRPSDENLKKAITQFEQAIALDPNFAPPIRDSPMPTSGRLLTKESSPLRKRSRRQRRRRRRPSRSTPLPPKRIPLWPITRVGMNMTGPMRTRSFVRPFSSIRITLLPMISGP